MGRESEMKQMLKEMKEQKKIEAESRDTLKDMKTLWEDPENVEIPA